MIRNIKSRKSMAFMALRVLWKMLLVLLKIVAILATGERSKPPYSTYKAQELFDDGLISIAEYNKSIHGSHN